MSAATSASEPRGVELGSSLEGIWSSVDRLIDRTDDLRRLRFHRLELLVARRWRSLGRPLPEALLAEERSATARLLAARAALARLRAVYDGPMTTYKGLSAAAVYPDPATRPFGDIDVLVPNAAEVQRTLLAAGCKEVGDPELFVDIHHLRPLMWPRLPIPIEIHDRPKWPDDLPAPSTADVFAAARDGEWGDLDGVPTLPRTYHAVLLAAHAWAHEPLRRALDLVEVVAMADGIDRAELQEVADAFGLGRVWKATITAADDLLFDDAPSSWPLRLWARHLPAVRERTVAEGHLERWLSGFSSLRLSGALRKLARVLGRELRPAWDESWRGKLSRTVRALRRAFVARSRHDELLGDAASRGGFRGRDSKRR
jgi:putative nucleotidyltransferase-like protein